MLSKPVSFRRPFKVTRLPFLARLQRTAYHDGRRRVSKRLIGKPAKQLYKFAYHGLRLGGEGSIELAVDGAIRYFPLNARNTQFGALFMPRDEPCYEPETTALLDTIIGDQDTFFDVGANWGYYALLIAARPGFTGMVHAFEPFPATYADLAAAVHATGTEDRITCHNLGLSDKEGRAAMSFPDGIQSGLARVNSGAAGVDVPVATLDSLALPPPGVIKLDVEDLEGSVLAGGKSLLTRHKPLVVFESWRQPSKPDLTMSPFAVLRSLGYTFHFAGWVGASEGEEYVVPNLAHLNPGTEPVLGLSSFTPEQRFLLPEQINVFAVHPDRWGKVEAAFSG